MSEQRYHFLNSVPAVRDLLCKRRDTSSGVGLADCCAVAVRNRFIEKQGWALQPPFVHQQADLSGGGRDGHIDG